MKKLLAVTALLTLSATANAALYEVTLTQHQLGRAGNPPSTLAINPAPTFAGDIGNIPLPTCTYDDVSQALDCSGQFHFRSSTGPSSFNRIFDRYITDLNIVGGSASGTAAYDCVNGDFGLIFANANICGNYDFGENFVDEGSITYGPGITWNLVVGGDDNPNGPPQTITDYNMIVESFGGTGNNLVLQTLDWDATSSAGNRLTFLVGDEISVIPVPAAVWLFGSALGLLGVARRRRVV